MTTTRACAVMHRRRALADLDKKIAEIAGRPAAPAAAPAIAPAAAAAASDVVVRCCTHALCTQSAVVVAVRVILSVCVLVVVCEFVCFECCTCARCASRCHSLPLPDRTAIAAAAALRRRRCEQQHQRGHGGLVNINHSACALLRATGNGCRGGR